MHFIQFLGPLIRNYVRTDSDPFCCSKKRSNTVYQFLLHNRVEILNFLSYNPMHLGGHVFHVFWDSNDDSHEMHLVKNSKELGLNIVLKATNKL